MLEAAARPRRSEGRGRVVGIAAEAGMGKSRLVAEFVRNVRRRGHTVAFGECQAYGTKTPLLRLARDLAPPVRARGRRLPRSGRSRSSSGSSRRSIRRSSPARRCSTSVVGLSIPDSDLTRAFDAKLRKTSLEDLLRRHACGRGRTRRRSSRCSRTATGSTSCRATCSRCSPARRQPCRSCSCSPTGRRPSRAAVSASSGCPGSRELALDRMEPAEVAELVRSKMQQLAGEDAEVADALVELVAARSEGNPFYVEELLNFIVAQGIDAADAEAAGGRRLPESLHTLVLSRIDAAAEGPRRTMKVASVVGRVFPAPIAARRLRRAGQPRGRAGPPRRRCGRSTSSRSTARPTRRGCSSTS